MSVMMIAPSKERRLPLRGYDLIEAMVTEAFIILFTLQFINIYTSEDGNSYLRAYYVFIAAIPFIFRYEWRSILFKDVPLLFILIYAALSFYGTIRYGYVKEYIYVFFTISSFICGRILYQKFGYEGVLNYIELGAKVLIIASIVRDIVTLPILIESALDPRRNGLANFPIITAGGPNIEATILAIFAALMINRPIGKVLIILAILTSIAFQSRTGFACAAFILIVRTFINMNSFSLKKIAFIGSIIVIFSFSISSFVNLNFTVFDRIGNVRQELDAEGPMGHSVGRVMLWGTAAALVAEDPLGYGPGGAIRYAKDHLGARFIENNFHNIVIQFAADGGVLSAALYIILIVSILINCLKRRFANPIDLVVFIYIMTGFIQWTGYDPMGWIFIGMYSAMNRQMRLREGTDRQMYLQEGKEKR